MVWYPQVSKLEAAQLPQAARGARAEGLAACAPHRAAARRAGLRPGRQRHVRDQPAAHAAAPAARPCCPVWSTCSASTTAPTSPSIGSTPEAGSRDAEPAATASRRGRLSGRRRRRASGRGRRRTARSACRPAACTASRCSSGSLCSATWPRAKSWPTRCSRSTSVAARLVRDLAVHQHDQLAVAVEAAAQVVGGDVLAEVAHHRPVRQPAKALRDLEPVAVERPQLDDAEVVEPGQVLDALGVAERVLPGHLLERPLAEAADRQQQQPRSATTAASCSLGELARQRLRVDDLAAPARRNPSSARAGSRRCARAACRPWRTPA